LVRLMIAEYLRDCGYRVLEAGTVAEARTVLAAEVPVDLVFSDVQMPGEEDGFALARWVREHHPAIEVILASGLVGAAEKARSVCHDGPIIPKPYDHEGVLQRIQALLRKASRAAG